MLSLYESLAVQLKCPPGLIYVLKSVVAEDKVPLLLSLNEWVEPKDVCDKLGQPIEVTGKAIHELFRDGLVLRNEYCYKARSFYGILNTLLGEGKLNGLSPVERKKAEDYYIQSRLQIYDKYIARGQLKASSRVMTTGEALKHHQRLHAAGKSLIVTTDEAFDILSRSYLRVLVPCSCRLTFQNCQKPVNTCIILNESAREQLERSVGQQITVEEGQEILAIADREGLVHLTISSPGQLEYALCSCCCCCCHDLQALVKYGRSKWVQKADVIALDNREKCIDCQQCVDRCVFGARENINGHLFYDSQLCYGCGLCVTTCPSESIALISRG
ncbi:MAG: ATP-binding protein [Bacillota bacterium]